MRIKIRINNISFELWTVPHFVKKNVQISSLYCSFNVFYSFLGQLLTSLLTYKKHMFFCVKWDKGYCVLYNVIDLLLQLCKHTLIDSQERSILVAFNYVLKIYSQSLLLIDDNVSSDLGFVKTWIVRTLRLWRPRRTEKK